MAESGQGLARSPRPWNRWQRLAGTILIIALALLCEVLRDTPFRISNPPAFFIPAIVFAGFRGGLLPALTGAALAWLYTAYFFSGSDLLRYSLDNLNRVVIWAVSMPLTAWMSGALHQRASRAMAQAKLAEQEQERAKERARAEEALRESEALLRTFVDHAADAFFLHDTDDFGKILDVNRQACESLGYTREELLGHYPSEFDVGLSPEEVIRIGERVGAGETFTFETRHRRKDGTEFPVEMRVRPFQHGGKRLSVALARDVTELKRLETQFRQAQKMEALGLLAGGVAHDFNNLLMIITGYGELVFNRLRPDDPSRAPLAEIQKAAERAVALTRQLLAFSRKQVLQPQEIRLNQLLVDLLNLLRRLIGEDIELTQSLDPGLGLAKVDPGQFEQAIINLAVNARDAMPEGGRLSLATRNAQVDEVEADRHPEARPGRYVVVEVSDTGRGIDATIQARIFEPFFTTKEAGKGTGLGLAMVYGFVKQSGGHIEMESLPDQGTTFRLYLPRSEETEPVSLPARPEVGAPKGHETILLVEDEEAVRTLARLVLQSYGYTVLEAADGQEGLALARNHPGAIDAVVTDMVMPRMSGRQLADHLARERPELPILFMSGYTDDAILQSGAAEAGESFIPKPISPLALTRKVRQILDSETAPRKVASLPRPG